MKKFIVTAMLAAAFSMTLAACNNGSSGQGGEQKNASGQSEQAQSAETEKADDAKSTVTSIDENIDPFNLKDGIYHVEVDFSQMTNSDGGVVLNFGIYTPVHYEKADIENLKKGQTLHVHWGDTDEESEVIQVETVDVEDGYVKINGGLAEGGFDLMIDDSGYYRTVLENDATYYTCHGFVDMEVPKTVNFEDSYATPGEVTTIEGSKLYDHFASLSDDEKSSFMQNCTYINVQDGVITEFYRVYVP